MSESLRPYILNFEHITEPFWRTYARVDLSMLEETAGKPCQVWIRNLMVGFRREYDEWRYGPLQSYVNAYRESPDKVRLVGLAYLHMGYDLPRVLANHWPTRDSEEADRLQSFESPGISIPTGQSVYEERWKAYYDLNEVLANVYREEIPWKSLLPAPIIDNLPMLPVFWMFLMRERAWMLASELVRAGAARPLLEERIRQQVMERGMAFASAWILTIPQRLHDLQPPLAAASSFRSRRFVPD